MLRRALPVAVAIAAFALVPTSASAAPDREPVNHSFSSGYHATAEVTLADGRQALATLDEQVGTRGQESRGFLSLQVTGTCSEPYCVPAIASGSVDLTGEQVRFTRNLSAASVQGVTLTLTTPQRTVPGPGLPPNGELPPSPPAGEPPSYPPGGALPPSPPAGELPPYPPTGGTPTPPPGTGGSWVVVPAVTEVATVSVKFTGTGAVRRDAGYTYGECGDGSSNCHQLRHHVERDASAIVTLQGEASRPGTGSLSFDQSLDVAARPSASRSN